MEGIRIGDHSFPKYICSYFQRKILERLSLTVAHLFVLSFAVYFRPTHLENESGETGMLTGAYMAVF
jgi:hypothetical protein